MADKLPQEMESQRWAGDMGEKWNAHVDRFEGMIAPVGAAAIAHTAFESGERVIDIGCGAGATTFEIARLVDHGHVTGLDVSGTLVATARRRLADSGLGAEIQSETGATSSLVGNFYTPLVSLHNLINNG